MLGTICQKKVLEAVIRLYAVDVMDNLMRLKIAAELFFHHKAVLHHAFSWSAIWMIRGINIDIPHTQMPTPEILRTVPFFKFSLYRKSTTFHRLVKSHKMTSGSPAIFLRIAQLFSKLSRHLLSPVPTNNMRSLASHLHFRFFGVFKISDVTRFRTISIPGAFKAKKILFTALALSIHFFVSPSYCDDTQKGWTYAIDSFEGGLDVKTSEYSLSPNKGTVVENVRLGETFKSLERRTNLRVYGTADATEPITGLFRHYLKSGDKVLLAFHGDEMEKGSDSAGTFTTILGLTTGDHKWQCVTWHDIAICTDGYNQPVKYDGSSTSATYLGSLLATDAGSGSGPVTGSYSYKVGCYSTTYTVLLNQASNTISANGNDVSLSMIPVCNSTTLNGEATTGRKIYRTATNGSSYFLLSNGTIANNTATTLTDSDADAALGAAMPAGDATWTPPKGRFPIVQNNRLFLGNDPSSFPSRLYYGSSGSHDIFDTSNETGYFDIRQNDGDAITFVKGNLGILTVGKNNTIQKVYIDGADPDADWSISDPFSYVGCQAPYSVQNTPLGIIYLANQGLYLFKGQYSELISDSVTPVIDDISPTNRENTWGVYHDDGTYMLAYTSDESGESFNNRVLVLDTRYKAYSIDLLSINAFTVFNSGNDWGILYAGASDSGKVYAYAQDVNEIIHKRHSDFTGLWDDMRYIPTGNPGGDTEDPVLEISRTETINELAATINSVQGVIDRQDYIGHYVSQPLTIGATTLDKLYWNEVSPAGNSVTFQVRTSDTGNRNLLHNDSFEFWDNGPYQPTVVEEPNDWSFSQGGTGGAATASVTETHANTYSAKLTKPNTGNTIIMRQFSGVAYRGLPMAFKGWMKSANTVNKKVYYEVTDDATIRQYHYTNSGSWEEAATSLTVSSTANTITTKAVIISEADAVAYFDEVMLVQGTSATNDWTDWSSTFTNSAGSDISGVTADDYLQYLINMTTDSLTETPTIVKGSGYNVRLTYGKEGTAASTDIPLRWTSGWLDFGHETRPKVLRTLETYHEGTTGEITITVENFEGETDVFTINLSTNPNQYRENFTGGAMQGTKFKVDVVSTGITALRIDKILITGDTEPFVAEPI